MRQPKTFNDVALLMGCEVHANISLAQNGGNRFSPAQLFCTDRNHKVNTYTFHIHRDLSLARSFFEVREVLLLFFLFIL